MMYPLEERTLSTRQARIIELEMSLRTKIAEVRVKDLIKILVHQGVPKEELEGIENFQSLFLKMHSHTNAEYCEIFHRTKLEYLERGTPLSLKILDNIQKTRDATRELLLGDIEVDPAFQVLEEIQGAIPLNTGALEGHDEGTQELGKTWAIMFIEDLKRSLSERRKMEEIFLGEPVQSQMTLKDQYALLSQIYQLDEVLKNQVIQKICKILPSAPEHTFQWEEIKAIINEVSN